MTEKQISTNEFENTMPDYLVDNKRSNIVKEGKKMKTSLDDEVKSQKLLKLEQILDKLYGMITDGSITVDGFLEDMRKDNADYD